MTPQSLAKIHAQAGGPDRFWRAEEFTSLLRSPHIFVQGDDRAFVIGRAVADEAELILIATAAPFQRLGLAKELLRCFEKDAVKRGATSGFLEVAADNHPARALYAGQGWEICGTRRGYYRRTDAPAADATLMKKSVT